MFEIPTNTAVKIREEVVDAICKAIFKKKSLWYCDTSVYMDDDGGFTGKWDKQQAGRPTKSFSYDEMREAFKRIRDKGWVLEQNSWTSSCNGHQLWAYELKER